MTLLEIANLLNSRSDFGAKTKFHLRVSPIVAEGSAE